MTLRTPKTATTVDMVLSCLANERRRTLIECLTDESTPLEWEVVVQRLAEREAGRAIDTVADTTIQAIATRLAHVHLPKLADAGILDVDNERNLVQTEANFGAATALLAMANESG